MGAVPYQPLFLPLADFEEVLSKEKTTVTVNLSKRIKLECIFPILEPAFETAVTRNPHIGIEHHNVAEAVKVLDSA